MQPKLKWPRAPNCDELHLIGLPLLFLPLFPLLADLVPRVSHATVAASQRAVVAMLLKALKMALGEAAMERTMGIAERAVLDTLLAGF